MEDYGGVARGWRVVRASLASSWGVVYDIHDGFFDQFFDLWRCGMNMGMGMPVPLCKSPDEVRGAGPVSQEVDKVRRQIGVLLDLVEKLRFQLGGLLSDPRPTVDKSNTATDAPQCELNVRLRDIYDCECAATSAVEDILTRLQL